MNPDMSWASLESSQRERVEDVFHTALSLPAEDRLSFVRSQLAGKTALVAEVLELLQTFDTQERVGGWKAPDLIPVSGEDALIGRRIGVWQVEALIGRGGMGAVYLASRQDGQFEQWAALKLMGYRFNSAWLEDRFREERQNLARLNHPNIARLIDGGTTSDRDPYLVMEYVEGVPLDDYCRQRQLDIRQRIELFLEVCDAVTYTHQNLIIHRDIKPDNILVTKAGIPKLLDFGTAKQIALDAESQSVTQVAMRAFTPSYASPEEILGQPVTTRSDLYSLGVVLYRLLSGAPPYTLTDYNTGELVRVVCEQIPHLPSKALEATDRRAAKILAGDLDNIVMKALEKLAANRYGSVAELAEDLRRYLEGRPVRARAGGKLYSLAKFVRRHRWSVSLATTAVLALLATTVYSVYQTSRANVEAQKQAEVSSYLTSILQGTNVLTTGQRDLPLKQLLRQSADELDRRRWSSPEVEGTIRRVIADSLSANDDFEGAERHYRRALAVAQKAGNERDKILAMTGLGMVLGSTQRAAEATKLLSEAERLTRGTTDSELKQARFFQLTHLGESNPGEAEKWFPEAIRYADQVPQLSPDVRLAQINDYVIIMTNANRMKEAEEYTAKGIEFFRQQVAAGKKMPTGARILSSRAIVFGRRGDFVSHERFSREYKDHLIYCLGPEHRLSLYARSSWSRGLAATGRIDQALAELNEVDRALYKIFPKEHPNTFMVESAQAFVNNLAGRGKEAEKHAELARKAAGPEQSAILAEALRELGTAKLLQERRTEATADLQEAMRIYAAVMGKDSRNYKVAEQRLQLAQQPRGTKVAVTP